MTTIRTLAVAERGEAVADVRDVEGDARLLGAGSSKGPRDRARRFASPFVRKTRCPAHGRVMRDDAVGDETGLAGRAA